jgi:NodT family efflux transporter outer membrane factor (OMF) lipoprotein
MKVSRSVMIFEDEQTIRWRLPLGGAVILGISFLVSGCAQVERQVQAHEVNVPNQFQNLPSEPRAEQQIVLSNWIDDFNSPKLEVLIAEALENNRDLRVSAGRLMESKAIARVRTGALLPRLDVSSGAGRARSNFPDGSGGTAKSVDNSFNVSANLSWEIDVWGKLSKERRAALADFEAEATTYQAAQLSLAGRTAQAWFSIIEQQQRLELVKNTTENFERSARMVRSRYQRGLVRGLDVRLADSNLASARATLSLRQERLAAAKTDLEVLLGRYPSADISAAVALPEIEPISVDVLPSSLLARRPDLSAAKARVVATELRRSAAWAELLPGLRLSASSGSQSNDIERLGDPGTLIWNIAGGLIQPMAYGGQLRALAKAAEARGAQALAAYAGDLLTAFQEVEMALVREELLAQQEMHLAKAAHEAVAAEKIANDFYGQGLTGIFELLDAQRRSLNAQDSYLEMKRVRLANRVALYLALGGDLPGAAANEVARLEGSIQ